MYSITGKVGGWRLDRRSRRLTDPRERPVALSKSEGKTKSSLLKGKKIDELSPQVRYGVWN